VTEEEAKVAFEARRGALAALGEWVAHTIREELRKKLGSADAVEKFLQILPKPRVKTTDSFLEKAFLRKPKKEPLEEITDQVGIRFVVLLLEDISIVGSLISEGPWRFQKDRDYEQERLHNPDYFAYQSDHYVVWTNEEVEFKGVRIARQMPCEVQIRTLLQHAYAEMSHQSTYKPSIRLPLEDSRRVMRALARGSALIETTDDVFGRVKSTLREYGEWIDRLLNAAGEVYHSITGENCGRTVIGELVADQYRQQLKPLQPDQLKTWANSNGWRLKEISEKRKSSVFYRDCVVILAAWLADTYQTGTPKAWPLEQSYLEDLYTMMGISTQGLV
jgi:putative GTP pyrophosphokinase